MLTLERVFDAPVDLVWRCWTEPEHLAKWSAPRGYTIPEGEHFRDHMSRITKLYDEYRRIAGL